MTQSIHRKRLGLYVPWLLFVVFCLGCTAYWFAAKDAAIKALDAQIVRLGAQGVSAGYVGVRASGFPLHLTLTLSEAHLERAAPKLRVDAASLPVSVNLSNPSHLIIGLDGGVRWVGESGVTHALNAARAEMSVRFAGGGKLARLSLDLENAHVAHGDGLSTDIAKLLVHLRPDPRRDADAQLVLDADDWKGPTPFAALNGLSPFSHFRTALVLTDYATMMTQTPLQSWRGALRVERFDVGYAGTQVTGDGALDLDALHRPAGTLNLTPAGAQPVALVAADGWWTFAGLRVAQAKAFYSGP